MTEVVKTLEVADASHALADLFPSVAEVGELASVLRGVLETTQLSTLGYDDPAFVAAKGLAQFSVFYVDLGLELAAETKTKEAEESRRARSCCSDNLLAQLAGKPKLLPYVYGYGTVALTKAGETQRADELGRKLLEMTTRTGNWFNQVAWFLVSGDVPAHRNPALAIELARRGG